MPRRPQMPVTLETLPAIRLSVVLRVHRTTLGNWAVRGIIASTDKRGRRSFTPASIQQFISNCWIGSTDELAFSDLLAYTKATGRPSLLTVEEASNELGMTPENVRQAVFAGRLSALAFAGRSSSLEQIRIPATAITDYLAGRSSSKKKPPRAVARPANADNRLLSAEEIAQLLGVPVWKGKGPPCKGEGHDDSNKSECPSRACVERYVAKHGFGSELTPQKWFTLTSAGPAMLGSEIEDQAVGMKPEDLAAAIKGGRLLGIRLPGKGKVAIAGPDARAFLRRWEADLL